MEKSILETILEQRANYFRDNIEPTQVYMSEDSLKKLWHQMSGDYLYKPDDWKKMIGGQIFGLKIFHDDDFDVHVTGKIQTI